MKATSLSAPAGAALAIDTQAQPAAGPQASPGAAADHRGPLRAAFGQACDRLPLTPCTHSIGRRLSRKLALFTIAVLALLSAGSWQAVHRLISERNQQDLSARAELLAKLLTVEVRAGGEAAVLARLRADAAVRGDTRLEVWRADGTLLHADPLTPVVAASDHAKVREFTVQALDSEGRSVRLQARYTACFDRDAAMGERWAWLLALVTLGAGGAVAAGANYHVRRQLRPLHALAEQTRAISPGRLDQRLHLSDPAEELRPWIDQFNALMQRLEQAYGQLEAFNADVAHELRTPLAALIGETEVALSRERPAEALRDTLHTNLEELRRLSAMVNDMLFLSQADRGAVARRGEPVSLAGLAQQVIEFHEAAAEDAGLTLAVHGDASAAVDEPLLKRALSNLLGNAVRFAQRGSTVAVEITPAPAGQVRVQVANRGPSIAPDALPRLFDRFYRADSSRCCDDGQSHHGLGLAIVAAIARMHGGSTQAVSEAGQTRVGFTVAQGVQGADAG